MAFETVFFAIVALLVLGRLFQVLGQNQGAPPPFANDLNSEKLGEGANIVQRTGVAHESEIETKSIEDQIKETINISAFGEKYKPFEQDIAQIQKTEPFSPNEFEDTAAMAFEAIVSAYGIGDEATLADLTTPKVFEAYKAGIAQRKAENKGAIDIVKLSEPQIKNIELSTLGSKTTAIIDIEFSATLSGIGEKIRNTKEIWSFERQLGDKNPVWKLSAVHSA